MRRTHRIPVFARFHLAPALAALLLGLSPALAATPGQPVRASRATGHITVDGRLDEDELGRRRAPRWLRPGRPRRRGPSPASGPRSGCSTTIGRSTSAVRCFDLQRHRAGEPLGRRDSAPYSDMVAVIIDSNRDRRTAYYFELNAAGVQFDALLFGEDQSSGGLGRGLGGRRHHRRRRLDRRVPDPALGPALLGQRRPDLGLRGSSGSSPAPTRSCSASRSSWPTAARRPAGRPDRPRTASSRCRSSRWRRTSPAGSSGGRRATPRPARACSTPRPTWALDLRASLGRGLALQATVNPDFGQVEADTIQHNLSNFELFFPEKRPFFTQGLDLFQPVVRPRRPGLAAAALLLAPHRARRAHLRRRQAHRPRQRHRPGRPARRRGDRRRAPRAHPPGRPPGRPGRRSTWRLATRIPRWRRRGATSWPPPPLAAGHRGDARRRGHQRPAHRRALHGRRGGAPRRPAARPLRRGHRQRRRRRLEPAQQGRRLVRARPGQRLAAAGRRSGRDAPRRHRAAPGHLGAGAFASAGIEGGEPWRFDVTWQYESPRLDLNTLGYQKTQNEQMGRAVRRYVRPTGNDWFRSGPSSSAARRRATTDGHGRPAASSSSSAPTTRCGSFDELGWTAGSPGRLRQTCASSRGPAWRCARPGNGAARLALHRSRPARLGGGLVAAGHLAGPPAAPRHLVR